MLTLPSSMACCVSRATAGCKHAAAMGHRYDGFKPSYFSQVLLILGFKPGYCTKITISQQPHIEHSQNRHILKADDRKRRLLKY